jgi:hypothetical protein
MTTFTLPEQNWRHIKPLLAKILPLIALTAAGPLAMAYALSPTLEIFLFVIALLIFVTGIGISLAVFASARQKFIFENDRITHRRPFYAEVTISKSSVSSITEDTEHGLTIQDARSGSRIFVPNSLTGYEDLRAQLGTWLPIGRPPRSVSRPLTIIISLIAISSLAAVGAFVFRIKFLFFVFAISFFAVFIYAFVLSNKETPHREKTSPVFNRIVLALVLLYFLYEIIKSIIR